MKKQYFVLIFLLSVLIQCKKEEELFRNDLLIGNWELIQVTRSDKKPINFENYSLLFSDSGKGQIFLKDTTLNLDFNNSHYSGGKLLYKLQIHIAPKAPVVTLNFTHIGFGFLALYDAEINENFFHLISVNQLPLDTTNRVRDLIEYSFVRK